MTSTKDHTETPVTKSSANLSVLLAKQDGGDFLRSAEEAVRRMIVEADVEGLTFPGPLHITRFLPPLLIQTMRMN